MKASSFEKLWHPEPRLEHSLAWLFDWRFSAAVLRTRVTGVISLIPLLGYFILYGDQFGTMFLEMEALAGVPALFAPITRAHLIYFGSILVFGGWALCFLCPSEVKRFSDSWDFAERTVAQRNNGQALAANLFVSKLKLQTPQPFEQKRVILYLYGQFAISDIKNAAAKFSLHNRNDFWDSRLTQCVTGLFASFHASLARKHRSAAIAANTFFIFGILLIALPAVETFARVIASMGSNVVSSGA